MRVTETIYNALTNEVEVVEVEKQEDNFIAEKTVDEKILELQKENINLISSDLDFDFRLLDIEVALNIPIINSNIKIKNSMSRTPYEMMKILILAKEYDKADMENKMNKYLKYGKITNEQYEELKALIDKDN